MNNHKLFFFIGVLMLFVVTLIISILVSWKDVKNSSRVYFQHSENNNKSLHQNSLQSIHGWQPVGYTNEDQQRLKKLATIVSTLSKDTEQSIPTVPCLSADKHLLVLSVAASRVRYGVSLTFMMVFPDHVKYVVPKELSSSIDPISARKLNLWCIFADGSVTPAYSYDSPFANERASFLDCRLSPFALTELWTHYRILTVYLVSLANQTRHIPILKAFVTVPRQLTDRSDTNQYQLTLCTSPLRNRASFLASWIEFHRLVGFNKFVIYNTTDNRGYLSILINRYFQKYPDLIDVVQWNFSPLSLRDLKSSRYFQVEALHDCLIRYGDQSEWIGTIDLDEYIVPLSPYQSIKDYLLKNFRRDIMGSINLRSLFFCSKNVGSYSLEERNTTRSVIERFTFRARKSQRSGREKYLYRPLFVQYLSIHRLAVGLPQHEPLEKEIILAHYVSMDHPRVFSGCGAQEYIEDTSIRDRFGKRVRDAISSLFQ